MVSILILTIGLVGTGGSDEQLGEHGSARSLTTARPLYWLRKRWKTSTAYPDNDPNMAAWRQSRCRRGRVTRIRFRSRRTTATSTRSRRTMARPRCTPRIPTAPWWSRRAPISERLRPDDELTYHRRWQLIANPTVGGVVVTGAVQITVLVTLTNQSLNPPVSYQTSLVHP